MSFQNILQWWVQRLLQNMGCLVLRVLGMNESSSSQKPRIHLLRCAFFYLGHHVRQAGNVRYRVHHSRTVDRYVRRDVQGSRLLGCLFFDGWAARGSPKQESVQYTSLDQRRGRNRWKIPQALAVDSYRRMDARKSWNRRGGRSKRHEGVDDHLRRWQLSRNLERLCHERSGVDHSPPGVHVSRAVLCRLVSWWCTYLGTWLRWWLLLMFDRVHQILIRPCFYSVFIKVSCEGTTSASQ